jgi:glucose-6-phosphate dehydrogenase assembly protein OpcA
VTLIARGRFAVELPSATVPLLVSDLPVFLWWRDALPFDDPTFNLLSRASDRVILDSADLQDPQNDLMAMAALFGRERATRTAVSDLNWSRLTSWRALLASFYDVQEYGRALSDISLVRIEYVATDAAPRAIAPQALMIAGWLASRLKWRVTSTLTEAEKDGTGAVSLEKGGRPISIEFQRVERPEMRQGRLACVELKTEAGEAATFTVSRSRDGLYLETHATCGEDMRTARVLKVRNRSEAALISCELEIICRDRVYEEAIQRAAAMLGAK